MPDEATFERYQLIKRLITLLVVLVCLCMGASTINWEYVFSVGFTDPQSN